MFILSTKTVRMNPKSKTFNPMNLQNGQLQSEFELSYYEHQPEPDVRRDPNYVLLLFLLLIGLFVAGMGTILLTKGQLPFVN